MFRPDPKPVKKKKLMRGYWVGGRFVSFIKPNIRRRVKELEYYRRRKTYLKRNPKCAVCGRPSTQVHHKKGRVGDLLLDQSYWLPVDDFCHKLIHDKPEWAKENGYSVSRLT